MKSIFISKNREDLSAGFLAFCTENAISYTAYSFLTFKALPFEVENKAEVLFFGSKRAFDFYTEKAKIHPNQLITCIGSVTKSHIEKAGFPVFFSGELAGNAPFVASELKELIGNKSLLVLRSTKSYRSIPKAFSPEQCEERIVYETEVKPYKIASDSEILVFTSPSNVEGYLKLNPISSEQKVIAWGESTKSYLKEYGIQSVASLETSTEEELVAILKRI